MQRTAIASLTALLLASSVAHGMARAPETSAAAQQAENTPFKPDHAAEQATYSVLMQRVDQEEAPPIGRIQVTATEDGLRLLPDLTGLPPGQHGFSVNRTSKCSPHIGPGALRDDPAHDAGPVYDPGEESGRDNAQRPLGTLPPLEVGEDGRAVTALTASSLRLSDIAGRTLVVYKGARAPAQGEGEEGDRIACGIIRR